MAWFRLNPCQQPKSPLPDTRKQLVDLAPDGCLFGGRAILGDIGRGRAGVGSLGWPEKWLVTGRDGGGNAALSSPS